MKANVILLSLVGAALLLEGCIALPPLVQVERKDAPPANNNAEVLKRLDAIDKRLDNLEQHNK